MRKGGIDLEQLGAAPEHPDPHRAVELVAAEGDEVGAERGDVDGQVRHRLAGVDDDEGPDGVGPRCELAARG